MDIVVWVRGLRGSRCSLPAAVLVFAVLGCWTGTLIAQDEAAPDETESVPEAVESGQARRSVRRLGDVVAEAEDEWQLDLSVLEVPPEPQPQVTLPDPELDVRLQELLGRRAFGPDDPALQVELSELLDEVEAQARLHLAEDNLTAAERLVQVIAVLDEARPVIGEVRAERARRTELQATLARAESALEAGWLFDPESDSALQLFRAALILDADSEQARQGLVRIQGALLGLAVEVAGDLDFEQADELLNLADSIWPAEAEIARAREEIAGFKLQRAQAGEAEVEAAIEAGHYEAAEDGITQLIALGAERGRVERLRQRLVVARRYASFAPGQQFSEALSGLDADGPEMVVIPVGSFMMGSPDNERDRQSNEGPRFRVTFERGFALARTEITVSQFRLFVEDTQYRTDAERRGNSRIYDPNTGRIDARADINWRMDFMGEAADDSLPVVHVSFNDATAYVRWLARRTGARYRLPSEAEFEYALRAGSVTRYWWGDGSPDELVENLTGSGDRSSIRRSWSVAFRGYSDGHWGPAPVGSFQANPMGLFDMGGNVMEWVEDCWHDSYVRAPTDGSAWVNPGCERRVIRGGAWSSSPDMSRSAFRLSSHPDASDARVGFRVAREL